MMLLKMQSHRGILTSLFEKFTKKIFFKVNNIFSLMQVTNFKNLILSINFTHKYKFIK